MSLTGTGSAPVAGVTATSLTFSSQTLGTTSAAQTFTLNNTGNAALTISSVAFTGTDPADFAETNTCSGSVAASGSCTISVTFTPAATGSRAASLKITDNSNDVAGSQQSVSLTGTGSGSAVSLTATSLTFSAQNVGTTSTSQSITLNNTGNATLNISTLVVAGTDSGDFAQTNTCGSPVAAGSSCTISVSFAPTVPGSRSASVTITDNATSSPQSVNLTGTGSAPLAGVTPASLTFNSQNVGTTSVAQTLTLNNTGNTSLTITSIALTGTNSADYAQTNTCGSSVAASSSCTLNLTFTPTAAGTRTATLTLTDNSNNVAGSTQSVSLTGTGAGAGVSLSPSTLTFGSQSEGVASPSQSVTLTNTGNTSLTFTSISVTGTNAADFTQTNTCGGSVAANGTQPQVNDWGITGGGTNEGSGLCGALTTTTPFTATLGSGTVTFASIHATAFNGNFSAVYKGMDVHVPWLDTDLTGDATLLSGGGKVASISFPFTSPPITKTYGNFSFTASNLNFTQSQGIGWSVQTSTHFVFSTENKQFAAFDKTFIFGMDGRGYFANATSTADVSLGGSSHLGQTPVDLVSVHLTAPNTGAQVLAALFSTNVHLSEVMAAAPVQVNYSIDKSGTNYTTTGPANAPFTIDVPYPSGQPSSDAQVHPVYSGGSGSGGGGTEYSGTVDLSELGGPPITGEFRLGYQDGHDYWLTRVSYALGPTGIPLIAVPPVMNLYRVQGGLGHNFPISAFEDTGSISAATPVSDNSFLFMAGLRVGMPDQFTYTLDGDLTIKAGGQNAGARRRHSHGPSTRPCPSVEDLVAVSGRRENAWPAVVLSPIVSTARK